ncbi:MAG: hypothetical protein EA396_13865 [Anaerolineaceae bacterium]|nr:MAG: hypothetical protein EA396_13865 [Anaerolineaceae bacterium]
MRLLILSFVTACFWMVGCGGSSLDDANSPQVTYAPRPALAVDGVCSDTATLDRWLAINEFQMTYFMEYLDSAGRRSRAAHRQDLHRLNEVHIHSTLQAAPDCAAVLQERIADATAYTLQGLQAYANGQRDDVREIVSESRRRFNAIQPEFNELLQRLERQYRERGR